MKPFSLLLFLIPGICLAQDISMMQDKAAEPILDKISIEFDKEKPYQVEFQYEIYSAMEDARVSDHGSVIIKGSSYKLRTEDMEVIFNGKDLWTYSIPNAEVYKSEPSPESSDHLLTDPFTVLSDYKKFYKYQFKGESTLKGSLVNEVELYPVNLDNTYSMIEIYTNKKDNMLFAIILKQKDGLELSVYIKDIIKSIRISDSTFTWDQSLHPDVLLIEM